MFYKVAMLPFVLVLPLLAAANPVEKAASGVRIMLPKPASLTKPDGTFDLDRAILHTIATKNKHRQNLINLERNSGRQAFPEGAEIKPLITIPERLHRRQSLPLNVQESEWLGTLSVGTPKQEFMILPDTGSADLWVPSSDCAASICSSKKKYNPTLSSTSSAQPLPFNGKYGDGSTASGPVFKDTVTVASVEVKSQIFSAVTAISSEFEDSPLDGILGLALPSISNMPGTPFINTAFQQRAIPSNVFALKLASSGSSLFLGGADSSLFTGDIEYNNIDSSSGLWKVTGADISLGGTTVGSSFDAVIDSGTEVMYGTPSAVKAFYAKIPGAELFDEEHGFYSFPCNSVPSVSFSWGGGRNWAVSAENFNIGPTEADPTQCVGALAGSDVDLGNNVWLLGSSFMKNQYTVFSYEKFQVGFATLA